MKICVLLSLLFSVAAFADPQSFFIKWQLTHAPVNYFEKVAKQFKKNVEARSHGRIRLIIDREKKEDHDLLRMLSKNEIQMSQVMVWSLEPLNSEFEIFQLPFLFDSDEHLTEFSNSKAGRQLFASIEAKGVHAVDYTYSGGQMGILGPKINSMADLKGMKYNSAFEHEGYLKALKNIGLEVLTIESPLPSYDGLVQKRITAGEGIPWFMTKLMETPSLKEIYYNRTRHKIVTRVLILSEEFLKNLPADLRAIVLNEAETLAKNERKIAIADTLKIEKKFARTKHFNDWTAEQRTHDKSLFAAFYQEFIGKHTSRLIDAVDTVNPEKKPMTVTRTNID